jgi:Arc/MetJ family transcription regulator
MVKRTTIEIDPELLERARKALGETTTRGTVEAALRRILIAQSIAEGRKLVSKDDAVLAYAGMPGFDPLTA